MPKIFPPIKIVLFYFIYKKKFQTSFTQLVKTTKQNYTTVLLSWRFN